jgi:hypothetical protein
MKKVLWISRHRPTVKQLDEMTANGEELVTDIQFGSMNINTDEDVQKYFNTFNNLLEEIDPVAIYGVFPTPVLHDFALNMAQHMDYDAEVFIPVYAAWNIQRSVEGEKPTFEHKKFMQVGSAWNVHKV